MDGKNVELKIDGKDISVKEGTTIFEAAKQNGINIPTLCYLEGLTSFGGCRLCLVEVKGAPRPMEACVHPATSGMQVVTNSDKLRQHRKIIVQLLLADGNHICSICVANGNCELQDLANQLGIDHVAFEREWSNFAVDSTRNSLVMDRNRCILCWRCVRVCGEIEGVHTLDLKMRGKDSQIAIDTDVPWGNSYTCTSCGKCAKVCPVGAIYREEEPIPETRNKEIAKFVLSRRHH